MAVSKPKSNPPNAAVQLTRRINLLLNISVDVTLKTVVDVVAAAIDISLNFITKYTPYQVRN